MEDRPHDSQPKRRLGLIPAEAVRVYPPPDNPPCFACGADNPDGIALEFYRLENRIVTEFRAPRTFSGWGKVLHGGFQALLVDEICSWVCRVLSGRSTFVTRNLQMEFMRPVFVETPLLVQGRILSQDERKASTRGEILDQDGELLASGTAEIRFLSAEQFERFRA